ncbi:MAG: TIGR00341 family protein, partial [Oscillospiraceae bacterium]
MSKTTEKADEIDEGIEKEIKEKRTGLRQFFKDLLNMYDGMMSYQEIDDMMQENTVIHGPNMWILMLAALIASIGLNLNSTAVIIGAMLISPLMSGIMTMGYSLAVRDLRLLRRALLRFGTQVVISLVSSTIYFLISPLDAPTAEMIARTSPTIWDVLIALFGGIAGAIGNTREKKSNVIPGVAIATALMPPLCTAGYGLATMQATFFFGALYLFLINTLFISLSTMIVMMLLRVPYHRNVSDKQQKKINRAVAAITVVVAVPSIFFGASTVISSVMDKNISSFLSEEFVFSGTSVVQSSADKSAKTVSVSLVGTPISDDVIAMLEQEMPKYGLDGY